MEKQAKVMNNYGYIFDDETKSVVIDPSELTRLPKFNFRYIEKNGHPFHLIAEITDKEIEMLKENGYAFNEACLIDINPDDFISDNFDASYITQLDPETFDRAWNEIYG